MSRQSDNSAACHSCTFSSVFCSLFHRWRQSLAKGQLGREMVLGSGGKRNRRVTLWRGVSGASVRKWFLSNTAKRPQETECCCGCLPASGRVEPPACFSCQVDLYLRIFILDCKAQSILYSIPTAISLVLLLRLEAYTNACYKKRT